MEKERRQYNILAIDKIINKCVSVCDLLSLFILTYPKIDRD